MIDAMWKPIRWCEYLPEKTSGSTPGVIGRCLWLGPVWDHTLCAMVNDLPVCARYARARIGRLLSATCGNALPLFTGGQVVAGSNPVSPTSRNRL
jgi:hypothetical protein